MPKPRSSQVSLIETAYCVSRCVRRACFLLCSGRRANDEKLQNPYPQKTDRWDEAGQTTAIIGIPNKYSNIPLFCAFFNLRGRNISRNQRLALSFLDTANTARVFLLPLPT